MAIGLKDIKNPRKEKKDGLIDQKDRVLRPWEAYESLGVQTRTVSAQEAVKRAKLTVQKNNEMVESLKKNSYKPRETHDSFPEERDLPKGIFKKFLSFVRGIFYEN